jgi:predicted Zn-dependent protease
MGRDAEAAETLSRVLSARPRDRLARSALADALGALGRRAEAEALLRGLAAEEPTSPTPLRRLARFLAEGGEGQRAAAVEREAQALETSPRQLRPLQRDGR